MTKRKQNLILFLNNDDENGQKNISTKLVHSCMNRFLIDEESQFEILDVYYVAEGKEELDNLIQYIKQEKKYLPMFLTQLIANLKIPLGIGFYLYSVPSKTLFQQPFRDYIIEAFTRAQQLQDENTDTHFIFGLSIGFYSLLKQLSLPQIPSESILNSVLRLQAHMINNSINVLLMKLFSTRKTPIMVTCYHGLRLRISSKDSSDYNIAEIFGSTYQQKMTEPFLQFLTYLINRRSILRWPKRKAKKLKNLFNWFTIGDDLESWYTEIQNRDISIYPIECQLLKAQKLLTINESKNLKLRDREMNKAIRQSLADDKLPLCNKKDRLFLDERCSRFSFILLYGASSLSRDMIFYLRTFDRKEEVLLASCFKIFLFVCSLIQK